MNKSVFIILVNWNNTKYTIDAIREVKKQTYANCRIIVVDNNSNTKPDKEILKIESKATIIQTGENLGYSGGNNRGMEYALRQQADFILFMNSDVFLDPKMIGNLVKAMDKDKNLGAVGPRIYYYQDKKKIWFIEGPINWIKGTTHSLHQGEKDKGRFKRPIATDRLAGTAMLIRSEILEKIGGFDETYFMFLEDVDLSVRIRKEGYMLKTIPQAILWHNESTTTGGKDSKKTIYYYTRNKLYFMRKNANFFFFMTSFLYEVYFCLRRTLSHSMKRKIQFYTIRAMVYGFVDFFKGNMGRTNRTF